MYKFQLYHYSIFYLIYYSYNVGSHFFHDRQQKGSVLSEIPAPLTLTLAIQTVLKLNVRVNKKAVFFFWISNDQNLYQNNMHIEPKEYFLVLTPVIAQTYCSLCSEYTCALCAVHAIIKYIRLPELIWLRFRTTVYYQL